MTQARGGKCIFCNRSGGELRTIEIPAPNQFPHEDREPRMQEALVHPEHEARDRDFVGTVHRESGRFVVAMLFLLFLLFVPAAVASGLSGAARGFEYWVAVFGGAVLLLLGVFMARYPFATPQTTRLLGLKYSIWLVRVAAVGSVTGGIWLLVRGLA